MNDKCIKATGVAAGVEALSLNCHLNREVPVIFYAVTATRKGRGDVLKVNERCFKEIGNAIRVMPILPNSHLNRGKPEISCAAIASRKAKVLNKKAAALVLRLINREVVLVRLAADPEAFRGLEGLGHRSERILKHRTRYCQSDCDCYRDEHYHG